jgi:hypothetical protein
MNIQISTNSLEKELSMKIQFSPEKFHKSLFEDANSRVKTKSLVKAFDVYNDVSYYKTGNNGSAAGSTKCCGTGTCDIDS